MAANGVESGPVYASQWIELDEPEVTITGKETTIDDNGAVQYKDVDAVQTCGTPVQEARRLEKGVHSDQVQIQPASLRIDIAATVSPSLPFSLLFL